ncbi:hypothetical protein LGW56_07305, partial [Streptococcus mutans]|nr:hypothetical protein [Streptococcus mutans]
SQNDSNSSSQIDQTIADTNRSDSDHISKTSAATTEDQEEKVKQSDFKLLCLIYLKKAGLLS